MTTLPARLLIILLAIFLSACQGLSLDLDDLEYSGPDAGDDDVFSGDDEHGDDEHGDDEHGDDEHGDDEHGDGENGAAEGAFEFLQTPDFVDVNEPFTVSARINSSDFDPELWTGQDAFLSLFLDPGDSVPAFTVNGTVLREGAEHRLLFSNLEIDSPSDQAFFRLSGLGLSPLDSEPFTICSITAFQGGGSSDTDPFRICNDAQLRLLSGSEEADLLSASFQLIRSIPLSSQIFDPIGSESVPFTGIFDGQGFTISNLEINSPAPTGLFAVADNGARISNLHLQDFHINGFGAGSGAGVASPTGALVGILSHGTLEEITLGTGEVTSTSGPIGAAVGIVGANSLNHLKGIHSSAKVNGRSAGGLVGLLVAGLISESSSSALIEGEGLVGGLVGENRYGKIEESFALSTLVGSGALGGLVGLNRGGIHNSFAKVNFRASSFEGAASGSETFISGPYVGGLVGWTNSSSGSVIEDSYAFSEIAIESVNDGVELIAVGGLVGHSSGIIHRSYAAGVALPDPYNFSPPTAAGPILGADANNFATTNREHLYYHQNLSTGGDDDNPDHVLSESEFGDENNFSSEFFNGSDAWEIRDDPDTFRRPHLRWEP